MSDNNLCFADDDDDKLMCFHCGKENTMLFPILFDGNGAGSYCKHKVFNSYRPCCSSDCWEELVLSWCPLCFGTRQREYAEKRLSKENTNEIQMDSLPNK